MSHKIKKSNSRAKEEVKSDIDSEEDYSESDIDSAEDVKMKPAAKK
jgi:hypothetical protein